MLKCPNCGTDKTTKGVPFVSRKALNTHVNFHCPKRQEKDQPQHTHKFVLLNPAKGQYGQVKCNLSAVRAAMAAGHTTICEGCGEVE